MMQALARQYVRYFNHYYKRTGTLWEGRFKPCLVEDEVYLLHLYRYIALNPVRAGTVTNPAEHQWSSYQANALGKTSMLCTPHSLYIALGMNIVERQICY
ncbi:MAG: putative transposase [Oleiphilaceae bacterium]|jgi:putative transposase